MIKTKTIAFDMDGTIYDLYSQEGWLNSLKSEKAEIFLTGKPMVDLVELKEVCQKLQNQGWTIGVITWLPMDSTLYYQEECTRAKEKWLEGSGLDFFQFFKAQPYGEDKKRGLPFRAEWNILVDDNKEVRAEWEINERYTTINAEGDIIAELKKLLK